MKYEMMDAKAIIGEVTAEEAEKNETICVISTDSAPRTGMGPFIKAHPDRYYECGIMEQGAMSVSSGLATTGKTPVFCAPAPFATARPFEMFKIDLGYMHQNVKVIGRNCGFNYADLGPTHFGLEDMALVRLIPNVPVLAPCDASQLKGAMRAMLRYDGPVYLRVRTAPIAKIFDDEDFEIGKGKLVRDGKDIALIAAGEILSNVLEAAEQLVQQGFDPMVIAMPTVFPLDEALVRMAAEKTGKIMTVEEHFVNGGLGSAVAEFCAEKAPALVLRHGVPMEYVYAGQNADLIHYCKLDAEGIAQTAAELLNEKR